MSLCKIIEQNFEKAGIFDIFSPFWLLFWPFSTVCGHFNKNWLFCRFGYFLCFFWPFQGLSMNAGMTQNLWKPPNQTHSKRPFAVRRFHSECAVDGAQRRRKFWHFGPSFLARFLDILRFRNEPNFLSEILKAQFLSHWSKTLLSCICFSPKAIWASITFWFSTIMVVS